MALWQGFGRVAGVVFAQACVDQGFDQAGSAEFLVEAGCGTLLNDFLKSGGACGVVLDAQIIGDQ